MTRPDFERAMAELHARIAQLPESERPALEQLARETVERHNQIVRDSLQSARALERLELAWERMESACGRLADLAQRAQETLARAQSPPPPAHGTN